MPQYKALGISFSFHEGKRYHLWIYRTIAIVGLFVGILSFVIILFLHDPGTVRSVIGFVLSVALIWLGAAIFMAVEKAENAGEDRNE